MRVQLVSPKGAPTVLIPLDYLPPGPVLAAGGLPHWDGRRPCVVLSLSDGELTAEPALASWRTAAPIIDDDEIRWPIPQPLTTAAAATLLPELTDHAQAILDDTTDETEDAHHLRFAVGNLGRGHAYLIEQHIARRSQELPACQTLTVEQWISKIDNDDPLHPTWWSINAADTDTDLAHQARMIQSGPVDIHPGPLVVVGLLAYMQAIRDRLRDAKRATLRRHGDELRALQDRQAWLTEQILPPLVHEIHGFGDDKIDSNRKLAEAAGVSHTEIGRWLNNPLGVSRTRAAEGKTTAGVMLGDLAHVLERPDEMFDVKPGSDLAAALRNHVGTFDTVLIDTPPADAPPADMPAAVLPFKGRLAPKTPFVDGEGNMVGSGVPASRTTDLGTLAWMVKEKFGDLLIDTDTPAGTADNPAHDTDQKRHGDGDDAPSTQDDR